VLLCRGGLDVLDPASLKKFADIPGGLADALFILDESNPDMSVALLAKSGSGGDRHMRFIDQLK
jgi:hypothetical protein